MGEDTIGQRIRTQLALVFKRCCRRGAQIHTEEDDEESGSSSGSSSGSEKISGSSSDSGSEKDAEETPLRATQNVVVKLDQPVESKVVAVTSEITTSNEVAEGEEILDDDPDKYMEWVCLVCNTPNRGIKHNPDPRVDIYFGEKGLLYKRMYAHLIFQSPKPTCKKCFTLCDYQPPPGSAHIFPHYNKPHIAFTGYPQPARLLHGLDQSTLIKRIKQRLHSFLFGKAYDGNALPTINDWRLKKYLLHHYPKILKYELKPNEQYEVGEIVESRQQKSEYCRARIINVNSNGTVDIQYDGGDECRFVRRQDIRLGTEKRAYAYRVEMMAVMIVVSFPLCLMLAIVTKNNGFAFLSMLIVSLALLVVRITTFVQYAYNFADAGILVLIRFSALFTLPVFFFFLTSILAVMGGSDTKSWTIITAMAIMTKVFSLPVLYLLRPTFAIVGMIIFLQTSIGLILLTKYVSKDPVVSLFVAIPLGPFITTTLTLKYLRKELHNIWDTCFVIRPKLDDSKSNPWIVATIREGIVGCFESIRAEYF
jgi:hypothetical protein